MLRLIAILSGCLLWMAGPAAAQLLNNASIKGTYNFRYVGVNATSNDVALSYQGTVTFDGTSDANLNGTFSVTGQGAGALAGPPANNVYSVLSSGLMYMNNPFDPTGNTFFYGGVGNGALVLSSTDSYYSDFLVALPVATSASAATLNGQYYIGSMDILNGTFLQTRNTFFTATADGKGGFGNVTISGTANNVGTTVQTQMSSGATYTVTANGSGTMNFPTPSGLAATSQLLSGTKVLFVSQDGNVFIGGGTSGYDMIIGVKALSGNGANAASGLYYTGFLDNYIDTSGNFSITGADGAANEANGTEIGHQRVQPDVSNAYDNTYASAFAPVANGTVTYNGYSYVVGGGGNYIMGAGTSSDYLLQFYVKAPSLTGSGVFLNPQYIVNAASYDPFTQSVSPGEFISLYGTGMSSQTATASSLPFPTTLGQVQVAINWYDVNGNLQTAQAPLYYVSPTQISLVVPYTTPGDGSFLNFTITNNGTASNVASVYSGPTSPGIFTIPANGISNGAILHADYSLVSTASPAKVGETVQIYLTGMGAVSPAVTAGTAAPSTTLSQTLLPDVYIDGVQATVAFSGLAPGFAGLYQLNVTIPSVPDTGTNVVIEIDTFDDQNDLLSVNMQATIPISK